MRYLRLVVVLMVFVAFIKLNMKEEEEDFVMAKAA